MEIIEGIDRYNNAMGGTCVTVGTFDGLHVGHRKIMDVLVRQAREEGLRSVVVTFDPHPRQVLSPDSKLKFVLTRREKEEMFAALGIDVLVIHPFSRAFAALSAKEFLSGVLKDRLMMRRLVKGFNNHFGCDRLSDLGEIQRLGEECGFSVTQVGAECRGGVSASSTLVRRLIGDGSMEDAAAILGYDYFFEGEVVHGRMIGRTIGFPTANINIGDDSKILPRTGAYVAAVKVDNDVKPWPTILNVGSNPTVNNVDDRVFLEAHLIGFDGDLYGRRVRVSVLHRLRDEVKFGTLSQLKRQLQHDTEAAQSFICQYAS